MGVYGIYLVLLGGGVFLKSFVFAGWGWRVVIEGWNMCFEKILCRYRRAGCFINGVFLIKIKLGVMLFFNIKKNMFLVVMLFLIFFYFEKVFDIFCIF